MHLVLTMDVGCGKGEEPESKSSGTGATTDLTYFQYKRTQIRRIRKKKRHVCTKEIGIDTSIDEFDFRSVPGQDGQHTPLPVITEAAPVPSSNDLDGARTTEVEETPKIDPGEESSVSEETVTPTHVSHDNDNNPVQIYEFPAKYSRYKTSTPPTLNPVSLSPDDIRDLLSFVREKGLTTTPRWQRQGITRMNQFLLSLEPFSAPLSHIRSLMRSEIQNTKGGSERLIFFYLWFAGLTIEELRPEDPFALEVLINQIRTPIRRIYELNADVKSALKSPIKRFRTWILPLARELDQDVYSSILRMTPSPIGITNQNLQEVPMEPLAEAEEVKVLPSRPNLLLTSVSTILLISYDQNPIAGTKKVSSLTTKAQTYVIQGILTEVERLVMGIAEAAINLRKLFKGNYGEALKESTTAIVQELRSLRRHKGLRHTNATTNFCDSLKLVAMEMLRMGQTFHDFQLGTEWMAEALEVCIRQGETWVPESLRSNLTARKQHQAWHPFQACFKGNWEEMENFHEFFGTKDFGGMTDSFQVKVPIRTGRMKVLFPDREGELEDFPETLVEIHREPSVAVSHHEEVSEYPERAEVPLPEIGWSESNSFHLTELEIRPVSENDESEQVPIPTC